MCQGTLMGLRVLSQKRGATMLRNSLRSLLVASSVLAVLGLVPASAQYYPQDQGDDDAPAPYYPRPYPQPQPYYPQPGYEPNPYGPGGGYGRRYGPPRAAGGMGYHCATGRGLCETGYPAPIRSPCRCDFGYERKRGVVVP
jgi:hypothetical protein